jgi:esterase/lipase
MHAATPISIPLPHLAERHQASGLNSKFNAAASYADYLDNTEKMLRLVHLRLGSSAIDSVVAGNMPFRLYPTNNDGKNHAYRRGILLTHGLTDSPYFMRDLGAYFQAQGFVVMAVLLPGHGTQPGDLVDISLLEWAKAVAFGTECLAQEVDELYMGGLSTGATLSIYQSQLDERVRGLFLYSPALQISSRAAYAKLHKIYSWMSPTAKWLNIQPDYDVYKYESFAKNGAAQMYELTQKVQAMQDQRALALPIFAVASGDDTTVQSMATLDLMDAAVHPASKLLWYSNTAPKLQNVSRLLWVDSAVPEQRILSSAHTAIVLSESDPHYGRNGDYSNCAHYYPHEPEKYIVCRTRPAEVAQGEITADNLQSGIMRRLMYNPNFAGMTSNMTDFINALE